MNEITIFLSEQEAIKFREFQKNYTTFMLMLNRGVFDVRKGNVTLNFDHEGTLQAIRRDDFIYSREHDARNT